VLQMKVRGVALDQQMNPVVLLVDNPETMALPIWIGQAEATAIAMELQGVRPPRPMTHDLLRSVLTRLEASVARVVVTDVRDATYFAEIHVAQNGNTMVIDSRPSDAIALALRMEAPIFVEEKVAAQAIQLKKPFDEEMEEWKKFLEKVKPSDFSNPGTGGTLH
jgi:bifunctional DNase/RNase